MALPCQGFDGSCQVILRPNLSVYTSISSWSTLGIIKTLNFCQASGFSSCFAEVETEAQRMQEGKELGGRPLHPDGKARVFA